MSAFASYSKLQFLKLSALSCQIGDKTACALKCHAFTIRHLVVKCPLVCLTLGLQCNNDWLLTNGFYQQKF